MCCMDGILEGFSFSNLISYTISSVFKGNFWFFQRFLGGLFPSCILTLLSMRIYTLTVSNCTAFTLLVSSIFIDEKY